MPYIHILKALFQKTIYELGIGITNPFLGMTLIAFEEKKPELFICNCNCHFNYLTEPFDKITAGRCGSAYFLTCCKTMKAFKTECASSLTQQLLACRKRISRPLATTGDTDPPSVTLISQSRGQWSFTGALGGRAVIRGNWGNRLFVALFNADKGGVWVDMCA